MQGEASSCQLLQLQCTAWRSAASYCSQLARHFTNVAQDTSPTGYDVRRSATLAASHSAALGIEAAGMQTTMPAVTEQTQGRAQPRSTCKPTATRCASFAASRSAVKVAESSGRCSLTFHVSAMHA